MPRFFFHTEDGECFPDDEGVVLATIADAKRVAVQVLCDALKGRPQELWHTGAFRLICQNEDHLTLFHIEMTAILAAAFPLSAYPPGGKTVARA